MSDLLSRVPVSDADHPAPQNHAAEQERNMGRLLGDESMYAWSCLPNVWEMKKLLRGGGQDHE